jgi:hypothetical protein
MRLHFSTWVFFLPNNNFPLLLLFCVVLSFFFFLLIFICFMILLLNPAPNTLNFVTCHAFYASGSASLLSTRAQGAIHPSLGRHGPSSILYLRPLNYFLLALRRDHRLFPWLMHPRARSMPWSEQGIGDFLLLTDLGTDIAVPPEPSVF